MSRQMLRYEIPVDGSPHACDLGGHPVHVAAVLSLAGVVGGDRVEFWAEGEPGAHTFRRVFEVFGTGQPLPSNAKWWGTTDRTPSNLVWHLYELTP